MPIYRPSELKSLLEQMGAHPKKRFSQNFLIDGNVIRKIADLADIKPGDEVVEIGPGPGALTEELLSRGARVIAIEKDTTWADSLSRLEGDLTVIADDVLECNLELLVRGWLKGDKAKLVANLPYNITTPILTGIAPLASLFSDVIVMVQEEVARRFTSPPGSREYGSITLFLNFWSEVKYGFKVKNSSFYPSPKVDSALIQLKLKPAPLIQNQDKFFEMTRKAFGQRRKMLKVSLREILPASVLSENQALLEKRPEALSLQDFIVLYELISKA